MKTALKILLPILLIAAAVFGAKKLVEMKSEPPKREVKDVIPSVTVIRLKPASHRPEVRSFGTIQSYDEARITPEISAKIVWISDQFRVGKEVKTGDVLVKLEKRDFEIALEQQRANLIEIERQLAEEKVRSQQAADDWIASGRELATATEFRLRKPQLAALQAQLKSAEATITKAELDIKRTDIRAPFDARILQRNANLGELASPQTILGTLTSTEKAELRLPLTSEQISRIDSELSPEALKNSALEATLTLPNEEGTRKVSIVRLDPTIDTRNQVRYLIAEIDRPFVAEPFPLPIGAFVNVTMEGKPLKRTYRLTESALVEDSYVWIVNSDDELVRFPMERLATEDNDVIGKAENSSPSEISVVARPLTTFRPGTKVQVSNPEDKIEEQSTKSEDSEGAGS